MMIFFSNLAKSEPTPLVIVVDQTTTNELFTKKSTGRAVNIGKMIS